MLETIALTAIIIAAGFLQGMTGFGFVLIALPLLGLFLPLKTIIPLLILLALFISAFLSWQLRTSIKFKNIALLFCATLPGIPLGVYALQHISAQYLSIAVGILMIAFTTYLLLVKPEPRPLGLRWTVLAGFLAGIIGGSIGAGGPPVVVYSNIQPWSKDEGKGTMAFFFLILGAAVSANHIYSGLVTDHVIQYLIHSLPALAFGIWLGVIAYKRISDTDYKKLVFVLVFLLGCMTVLKNI